MAQPTPYNRLFNLAAYAVDNPIEPYSAELHDSEFDAVEQTLDGVCTNQMLIQRDDGRLANGSVYPDTLSTATRLMISNWNPRGIWTTATVYAMKDVVEVNGVGYVALVAHLSTVFATDYVVGKWMQIDVNMEALAAPGGSSLVGFLQSGTGTIARTVQSKERDIISLKDFENTDHTAVTLDGVQDDTSGITAAFAAIKANGGGMLFHSGGRAKITSKITLDKMPMYRVVGVGGKINTPSTLPEVTRSSVFVNAISGGGTMFEQNGTVAVGDIVTGPNTWEHVAFDCSADNTNHVGFDSRNGYDMTRFEHCSWLGGKWGWTCSNAAGVFNVKWEDCSFFRMKIGCYLPTNGGSPDYLNMVWDDCLFRYCTQYAVKQDIGTSSYFNGCVIEACTLGGLLLDGVISIKIDSTHFEQNGTGYDVQLVSVTNPARNCKNLVAIGNTFTRNIGQLVQFQVDSCGRGIFIGNTFTGAGGTASLRWAPPGGQLAFDLSNTFDSPLVDASRQVFSYTEEAWTPAFTGLTVVNGTGGATFSGSYIKIGNVVHFTATIIVTGTCTTQSVAGTTFINNMPFVPLQSEWQSCVAIDHAANAGAGGSLGIGVIRGSAVNVIHTPAWGALNSKITISGSYMVPLAA